MWRLFLAKLVETVGRRAFDLAAEKITLADIGSRLPRPAKRRFYKLLSYHPVFYGAGIRIAGVADDISAFALEMEITPLTRNYVGTAFGGSLYAMCDPFFMLILMEQLGDGFIVWDKAATIRFKKPGRKFVRAHFYIPPERVAEIRDETMRLGKCEPVFTADVIHANGEVVATVEKTLWVKKR